MVVHGVDFDAGLSCWRREYKVAEVSGRVGMVLQCGWCCPPKRCCCPRGALGIPREGLFSWVSVSPRSCCCQSFFATQEVPGQH